MYHQPDVGLAHLESEVRREASALMIAPNQVHIVRIGHLEGQEIKQHLAAELSTIHVISQKEVAGG